MAHTLVSLLICLAQACTTLREPGTPCPAIEMSAVADTQTDSTRVVALIDTIILASGTPLVATGDITGAVASQAGDGWVLNFTVTDAAATRVREFTTQNVGSRLALVVDGQLKGMPRIAAAIIGNGYHIGEFTQADAERIATAISNGCRR